MKRRQIRKDEARDLSAKSLAFSVEFDKKDKVEVLDEMIVTKNSAAILFLHDGQPYPLLKAILSGSIRQYRKVVVDAGAVKFVASGADVMRPGITQIDDGIAAGMPVVVTEATHGKPLAVGVALFGTDEMRALEKGKAVKTLHNVGDKIWANF